MRKSNISSVIRILKVEIGLSSAVVHYSDPFKVLISTVLSQRTRDANTEKASERLFSKFEAPRQLANADIRVIEDLIKPSGFYKVKAGYIKEISRQLVERFNGEVPTNLDDLLSLSGVGRKTANCVLVYAYNKPAIPVDIHVHRISNRLGWVKTKTPEETEQELIKTIPKRFWIQLNDLMVKYGQRVCLPVNPKCGMCKIREYCRYVL